jgi:hypothetical protein
MSATLSLARASVYATGAFVGVLALCAGAAALSIGGPLTSYEANGLSAGASGALHDMKGALKRMRLGMCRRMPIAIRDMTPCPKAREASAKPREHATPTSTRAHSASAPHHPLRRAAPAHHRKPHHR